MSSHSLCHLHPSTSRFLPPPGPGAAIAGISGVAVTSGVGSRQRVHGLRHAAHPTLGGEPLRDRDGVIRFQHRRKISSIPIRNTVVPIAVRTTSGSCLVIEASNHRKPGVVMSIIPLDVQRRCERRWAARFSRTTESVAPRRPEREGQQIAGPEPDKSKRKPHRVEAAGSRPLSAV